MSGAFVLNYLANLFFWFQNPDDFEKVCVVAQVGPSILPTSRCVHRPNPFRRLCEVGATPALFCPSANTCSRNARSLACSSNRTSRRSYRRFPLRASDSNYAASRRDRATPAKVRDCTSARNRTAPIPNRNLRRSIDPTPTQENHPL